MAGGVKYSTDLMLVGGAISDRFPPNTIAAIATATNTSLTGSLTLILLTNMFNLYGMILISGLFSISEAFLYPTRGKGSEATTKRHVALENLARKGF